MDKTEKAYLAGIIDGEGTVTLARHHKNQTPSPHITVANSSLPLLKWIKKKFGGCICRKKTYKAHHRQTYVWGVSYDNALRLLEKIKDYLIIKKPQANLILKKYKATTMRTGKYTPKMLKAKMKLVAKIRKLNQR
ncbi:LAGLIDADG family homing endonuclease [Candidatus Margulisiibacteriota bacterium]